MKRQKVKDTNCEHGSVGKEHGAVPATDGKSPRCMENTAALILPLVKPFSAMLAVSNLVQRDQILH